VVTGMKARLEPNAGIGGTVAAVTSREIAALYERVLEVDAVGGDDDFFVLGGSSLSAIALLDALREELGVQLPVKDFYRATRVADLAAAVNLHLSGATKGS
jgi:acyl carrier protein